MAPENVQLQVVADSACQSHSATARFAVLTLVQVPSYLGGGNKIKRTLGGGKEGEQ